MGVRYKIKPEKGHMVEKERFINESKELIIGILWKGGSVYTESRPTFTNNYDPKIGIQIFDIKEYVGHETIDGEVKVFFSETILSDEQEFLNGIISEPSYHEILRGFGWENNETTDIVIWGDLTITKTDE